jgi:hypothetical protein
VASCLPSAWSTLSTALTATPSTTLPSTVVTYLAAAMQVLGAIQPVPALNISAINITLAQGAMNASAVGVLAGGVTVTVALSSQAQTDSSGGTSWLSTLQVAGNTSLSALLGSYTGDITELGATVPSDAGQSGNGTSTAELVYDSEHGLRLLNISMGGARLGLGALAARLGLDWGQGSDDPISFSNPWLFYVPSNASTEAVEWNGQLLSPGDLGVAAAISMPSLNITDAAGLVVVQGRQNMSIRVGGVASPAWTHNKLAANSLVDQPGISLCSKPPPV